MDQETYETTKSLPFSAPSSRRSIIPVLARIKALFALFDLRLSACAGFNPHHPDRFFTGGDAIEHFAPDIVLQAGHSFLDRDLADIGFGGQIAGHRLQSVAHGKDLEDPATAEIAGITALPAALALIKGHFCIGFAGKPKPASTPPSTMTCSLQCGQIFLTNRWAMAPIRVEATRKG